MQIDDLLLNTTIRIDTYNLKDGCMTDSSGGTAFFYGFNYNEKQNTSIICLVTNRHVVEGYSHGRFSIKTQNDKGEYLLKEDYIFDLSDFDKKWIKHPNNKIDLCVLPLAPLFKEMEIKSKKPYFTMFTVNETISHFEKQALSNIEELYFIGYPDLIIDNLNNVPIVRRCITATSIKKNYNGDPMFLIDAPVFGGSSGSPVLLFKNGPYLEGNAFVPGPKIKLVGIVSGALKHKISDEITVKEVPAKVEVDEESFIQNNLGTVIDINELLKFDLLFSNWFA